VAGTQSPLPEDRTLPCIRAFLSDSDGATAIEYALIAALLAVGIIGALVAVGSELLPLLQTVADSFPGD